MARKTLNTNRWMLERRDGEVDRFSTYSDAGNAKRRNPAVYATTADIKFDAPPPEPTK